MNFGAVPDGKLASLDLSLPAQPFINTLVLPGLRNPDPRVFIGAAVWGGAAWSGSVFPPKTPATRYRLLYPRYFSAIELNATHYKIYPAEVLNKWTQGAKGVEFRFSPKFPQEISHSNNLQSTGVLTAAFLESLKGLDGYLGPVFLQLNESFGPARKEELFSYLASLPPGYDFFLELRHPQWFATANAREEVFGMLRDLKIGAVITDTPGRRDAVHMHLTIPKLILRFVCNGLHPSSLSRTDDWISLLAQWIDSGLEQAYIFLHPGNDDAVPPLASYWTKGLNKAARLELKDPTSAQRGLFDF